MRIFTGPALLAAALAVSYGLFLQPKGTDVWDQVGIVRYRSRRVPGYRTR
jgi:hypothetical protein